MDSAGGDVGRYTSLALDTLDRPHISYYDSTNTDLKYAYYDGAAWQIEIVDSEGYVGKYTSLALDTSDRPHISYYDSTNRDLKYAYFISYMADFSGDPTSGPEPLTVQFNDLSFSYEGIISWDWDFGDGGSSTEQNPTHQYTLYGVYTVCLTVAEADGDTDTKCKVDYITVEAPDISAAPAGKDFGIVAVGYVSPGRIFTISNNGTVDLVIGSIYLTGTNPDQFSILSENCSNQTIAPSGTCTIEARYESTETGTMYAKISVDSNDPDTPNLYIDLTGTSVNTSPPVADPGGPYTGIEGQAIALDGSGSTDSDGSISLYEWDIDNDGTYDYSSSSPTQSHTYAQQGTYTINLRVTDDLGVTDEATTTAAVSDTSPTADFRGSPTSGFAPLTVDFTDNSTGYDRPLSHEWDFDNDGIIDSTVQNPSYTYNTAGTYTVSLTVTDSDGSTNSLTRTDYITVDACLLPVRIVGATPVYYSTLQAAYDAAVDGDIIQSQAASLIENLNINRNISVTLEGGYNCDYTAVTGMTTLNGIMTISDGTATVGDFVLE